MLYAKPTPNAAPKDWKPLSMADDRALAGVAAEVFAEYWQAARPQMERMRVNDLYYRGEHWNLMGEGEPNEPRPHTPVLWSTVDNIHADLVEACPRAAVEAQTPEDAAKAETVGGLMNSLIKRSGFRRTWADMTAQIVRQGADVLEVFWDGALYGGLGDVGIQRWSMRNFLFDPLAERLDDSPAVIKFRFQPLGELMALYPDRAEEFEGAGPYAPLGWGRAAGEPALVYDFWWRETETLEDPKGLPCVRQGVYWCRVAGGQVVARTPFAGARQMSAYDHGRYPFVLAHYDRPEGSLWGLGVIDRFRGSQTLIDLADQMVLKNLMVSARNKLLVSDQAGIDMDALRDWRSDIIRGRDVSENAVRWFDKQPFAAGAQGFAQGKIAQMKAESGQNEFNRGEAGHGVTAASAIAALQEEGSKRSRKRVDALYAAVEEAFRLALALMCQFYTEERQYTQLTGDGPVRRTAGRGDFLTDDAGRMIDFDVTVHAEKAPGYRTAANNEQAAQLFKAGMIDAETALELMEFDRKAEVVQRMKGKRLG